MIRILIIGSALMLALTTPAAAQKKVSVEQALTQLQGLCERDYKPACIKFGHHLKIPPREARKLRSAHPEWWWWERW